MELQDPRFDVIAIGRSSIDLYANEIGAPFKDIKSFAAYVGGCPTNISVGTKRLGLNTALLTALGEDHVGDFVLNFLDREGIVTRYAKRKPGRRTSAFLLGIEPPDHFPIVPYRDNCADLELTIDDVQDVPISGTRAILITGTGLSRQPSRDATCFAIEQARAHGTRVILDLDFRAELWPDWRSFGIAMRSVFPLVNVVIGTADEVTLALKSGGTGATNITEAVGPEEELAKQIRSALSAGGPEALVLKRGAASTLVYLRNGETVEAATFPVDVYNVLGAGDAFASGLLYGLLHNWSWHRAARMGNACGAIVVTRHGCANFMPYEDEVLAFIEERGGF
jgi:5-dehydro-2-deoxygluconokinase